VIYSRFAKRKLSLFILAAQGSVLQSSFARASPSFNKNALRRVLRFHFRRKILAIVKLLVHSESIFMFGQDFHFFSLTGEVLKAID
jgi:hypothetical protein